MKYLKDKPVKELCGDQFIKLVMAEEEKLLMIKFGDKITGLTGVNYVEEAKQLYYKVKPAHPYLI